MLAKTSPGSKPLGKRVIADSTRVPNLLFQPIMQRILVIGSSGSGKSTLARAMGERLGLPVIHLDWEYWSPGWVEPKREDWMARVEALAARDAWVMDGNYSGTFSIRMPRTQAVVWLDLPRRIYFPRAVLRTLKNYGRVRPDLGAGCPERFDWRFFANWVWTYPARSRPRTIALLRELSKEKAIIILRRPREVRAFIAGLPGTLCPPQVSEPR
jgi:adenylate kinase family enzyme